ncbi:MAG TPA: hypothetical protein DDW30_07580 [Clostridiales bacterium]|nr:hypothetical protein [Clostridiales bacterium]
MKTRHRILTVLLTALLVVLLPASLIFGTSGSQPPFTGEALTYYNGLIEKGFPADYAAPLTRLHLLYPAWEFEPLAVSRSWKETVSLETAKPETNLIHSAERYSAYRHKTNTKLYDTGFYQASREAVSYFLDPRSFFTEADIFQFYDQRTASSTSREALKTVLAGTFMENAVLESGRTYASALLQIGEEVGIDPVFLAVRLRQEQGDGKSPLLGGKCGSLLNGYYINQTATTEGGKPIKPPALGTLDSADLTALDGYYNLFNIGASGDGVFAVYKNALEYAKSKGWTSKEEALRGGAEFLKNDYITRGQSTLYLQKFDVCTTDSLHQYMQNVGGAFSEGRSLYRSFAENGLTDIGCLFRIPVYSGMPALVSQDPAGGSCTVYASAASRLSDYTVSLTSPFTKAAAHDALFGDTRVMHNETLTVSGGLTGTFNAAAYEYAWDGGEWLPLPAESSFTLTVPPEALPAWGDHLLTIRARHTYSKTGLATHTLCAVLNVTVVPPPSVTLTLRSGNAEQVKMRYEGDVYTFPTCTDPDFIGYAGSDGTLYPSGYALTLTHSVTYTAVFLPFSFSEGAALYIGAPYGSVTRLRFEVPLPAGALDALPAEVSTLTATLYRDGEGTACAATRVQDKDGKTTALQFFSPELTNAAEVRDSFSVSLSLALRYSDGTERTLTAKSSQRTAVKVATAALADETTDYTETVISFLQKLIS